MASHCTLIYFYLFSALTNIISDAHKQLHIVEKVSLRLIQTRIVQRKCNANSPFSSFSSLALARGQNFGWMVFSIGQRFSCLYYGRVFVFLNPSSSMIGDIHRSLRADLDLFIFFCSEDIRSPMNFIPSVAGGRDTRAPAF